MRFVRRRQTSLGEDHFRVRTGEILQQAGSAGPERHATSRLRSRLGETQADFERYARFTRPHNHPSRLQADPEQHARFRGKPVSPELRRRLGGPKSTSYDKRASRLHSHFGGSEPASNDMTTSRLHGRFSATSPRPHNHLGRP